jgi:hypothetical protein
MVDSEINENSARNRTSTQQDDGLLVGGEWGGRWKKKKGKRIF